MPLNQEKILHILKEHFPDADITLKDLKGDGNYYSLDISCHSFDGKTRVQQHQMVYNSLTKHMVEDIHALSIKTTTKKT